MTDERKSLGERRTRASFNPSHDSYVDHLKRFGSDLINYIHNSASNPEWDEETAKEWSRLKALSLTDIESGIQWAVKMATTNL